MGPHNAVLTNRVIFPSLENQFNVNQENELSLFLPSL